MMTLYGLLNTKKQWELYSLTGEVFLPCIYLHIIENSSRLFHDLKQCAIIFATEIECCTKNEEL